MKSLRVNEHGICLKISVQCSSNQACEMGCTSAESHRSPNKDLLYVFRTPSIFVRLNARSIKSLKCNKIISTKYNQYTYKPVINQLLAILTPLLKGNCICGVNCRFMASFLFGIGDSLMQWLYPKLGEPQP